MKKPLFTALATIAVTTSLVSPAFADTSLNAEPQQTSQIQNKNASETITPMGYRQKHVIEYRYYKKAEYPFSGDTPSRIYYSDKDGFSGWLDKYDTKAYGLDFWQVQYKGYVQAITQD